MSILIVLCLFERLEGVEPPQGRSEGGCTAIMLQALE